MLKSTKNIWILVAKLFTLYTGPSQGSYAISWLEYRQKNMFDAKTSALLNIQYRTSVHCTTVPM